ncbi:response regulator transcription factor [Saccharothrix algeriensis]|uniref:DNA-binding response OmpR family regulator n=1 Tax=Saccharothrix algeriensis TaxID=173560 RepID=A0A8T8HW11_9PSEU|nr:response regulator transcription factor [Saccharothrix algeriensis]MBM7814232.1 DNA-binding response OmpR family regulator [Saccharothrix algeriensis]QTR02587.1 response regulator transcription factor [Saccharothrix algeriensis]
MVSVLLVEDDQVVRSAVTRALTGLGHAVLPVGTALEALREITASAFDLVVLDLGLPDVDGADALRMMRGVCDVPVIVATARDDEAEIVRLLNAGADDYLVKPFSSEHLAARLSAVLRRARKDDAAAEPIRIGELSVDLDRREARLAGRELNLTRKEFDLLAYLAAREGKVVPRAELLANLWNLPGRHDDQTLDVHLSWLRRKMGERAARPRYLHTVRGVGFKLTAVE